MVFLLLQKLSEFDVQMELVEPDDTRVLSHAQAVTAALSTQRTRRLGLLWFHRAIYFNFISLTLQPVARANNPRPTANQGFLEACLFANKWCFALHFHLTLKISRFEVNRVGLTLTGQLVNNNRRNPNRPGHLTQRFDPYLLTIKTFDLPGDLIIAKAEINEIFW